MAWASGVWRAISSSVISSVIPFRLGKSRRVARPILKNLTRVVADYEQRVVRGARRHYTGVSLAEEAPRTVGSGGDGAAPGGTFEGKPLRLSLRVGKLNS